MYFISIERENGDIFSAEVERVYYTDFGICTEVSLSWCEISAKNGTARGLILTSKCVKDGSYRIKRENPRSEGGDTVFKLLCLFPAESIVNIETCK